MSEQKQSNIIENVESFIQHYRNLDYIVLPEALNIGLSVPPDRIKLADAFLGTYKGEGIFVDFLANSITAYEKNKNEKTAENCLFWINRAFAYGVIKVGKGIIDKLKEYSEENIRLKKELETTSYSLMRAKEKIEELEQMMPNAGSEHA